MKNICIVGTGYVGLVTAACFADLGNRVVGIDVDEERVAKLRIGVPPIYEPGLEEMLPRNMRAGRLSFTTSYEEALAEADFAFIAVGTPSDDDGAADTTYVESAAKSIAANLHRPLIVINKSTVPIGTGDWVASIISKHKKNGASFVVVSNPEFMREGSAVHDFLNPDRVVLGSDQRAAAEAVAELYRPLNASVIISDLRTAEMIKYASNAFLATKISFINEIAAICDELGADVKEVARGMGTDKRIGTAFLDAGLGWGGSCFPKDVKALEHMASVHGCHPQLLRAVVDINRDQRRVVVQRLRQLLGSTLDEAVIGVLGLSFKPNTDDLRESPAMEVIHLLQHERVQVKAFDPVAMEGARKVMSGVTLCEDAYEVAQGADALVVVTEWNEFKQLDMGRIRESMRRPVLLDARNIYDPAEMISLGFVYRGIGRGRARMLQVAEGILEIMERESAAARTH
jgi:UDPglucose 6-dehydrogenase